MVVAQPQELKHCEVVLYMQYIPLGINGVVLGSIFRQMFHLLCTNHTI